MIPLLRKVPNRRRPWATSCSLESGGDEVRGAGRRHGPEKRLFLHASDFLRAERFFDFSS